MTDLTPEKNGKEKQGKMIRRLKQETPKGRYKEFEVIHETDLFGRLLKRLVLKNPDFKNNPSIEDYSSAIKIGHK